MTANTSRILIIGGGGIFGSRLCGHLARFPELQVFLLRLQNITERVIVAYHPGNPFIQNA